MKLQKRIILLLKTYKRAIIIMNIVLMAVAAFGLTKLEREYSQKSWFRTGDPLLENFNQFKKQYGSDISLITIFSFNKSVFNQKNMSIIYNATQDFWGIKNLVRIDSIANYSYTTSDGEDINIEPFIKDPLEERWTNEYLLQREQIARDLKPIKSYLISEDQKTIAIYGSFKHVEGHESGTFKETVALVKSRIVDQYQSESLKIMMTGPAVVGTTFEEESFKDLKLIIPLAFLFLFIFLTLVFKNFVATLLTLGIISITLITSLGIQGWLGIRLGLVTGMCPLIILAICVADCVHIFSSYLNESTENKQNKTPLSSAILKNITPTFLTTATTLLGFLSLCSAELYPIVDMGIIASIGIALAWYFTIFLLCPLLYLIPIQKQYLTRFSVKLFNFEYIHQLIFKHPVRIILSVMLLSCISFYLCSKNKVDSNMLNYFSNNTDFRKATSFFEKNIGGTQSIELIIESSESEGIKKPSFLNKVDLFIDDLYKVAGVTKVNSIITPLKEINKVLNSGSDEHYSIAPTQEKIAQELFFLEMSLPPSKNLNNLISSDKKDIRISTYWKRSSSHEIMLGTKEIEFLMKKHNLKGYVTGTVPLISGLDGYIVSSFFESMTLAIVLISLLMMYFFKSVSLGLFSMIPNIIVPSFGAAALYLFNIPFDAGSVLIFSICLGIAVDDTIFFLTNFEIEMKKHHDLKTALKNVLQNAGNTLSYTTFILVGVFSLFSLGSFIPNQTFAIATSIILSFALILDLVFLPSLIIYFNNIHMKLTYRS